MSIDFSKPVKTDNYDTGMLASLRASAVALAIWLDPALVGSVSNTPTGAKRLNGGVLEQYNGTSWVAQPINGINYSSGNVGIGIVPAHRFDLGPATGTVRARLGGVIVGNASSGYPSIGYNASPSGSAAWTYDFSDSASWVHFNAGQFIFYRSAAGTAGAAISPSESMRIDASGNMGLGTASPAVRLDVSGAARLQGTNPDLSIGKQNDGVSYYPTLRIWSQYNITVPAHTISQDAAGMYWQTAGGMQIRDGVAAATRLTIDGSGNVGIATASPAGLLDVGAKFRVKTDGRICGTALHNSSGSMAGTTEQFIGSGTYTPTITNVAGMSAISAQVSQWIRVGNVVTVSGMFLATTTGATINQVNVSLPIASNLTAQSDLNGVTSHWSALSGNPPQCYADASADAARVAFTPAAGSTGIATQFWFQYEVK